MHLGFTDSMADGYLREDVYIEELYSETDFNEMLDFVFTPYSHYILADLIREENVTLPAFVGDKNLRLGVEYQVRKPIVFKRK